MSDQLSIDFVRARRDDGIQRAGDHAGAEWKRRATGYLLEYLATCRRVGDDFMAEHVRDFAAGLDEPPDRRAWGAVFQNAARKGLIVKAGYGPAKSSNLSPKVIWRRIK